MKNNPKKRKILIVLDDMVSDEKLNPIVTELFNRERKLNVSLVFITRLEMKNYNTILKENLQKHQHYHQVKLRWISYKWRNIAIWSK